MVELKNMIDVKQKVKDTLETLKVAQQHLQEFDNIGSQIIAEKPNFLINLHQIKEYADRLVYQTHKYKNSNIAKKMFIEKDVRKKLKMLSENFSVMNS